MASSKNFLANGEKGGIKVGSEVTCVERGEGMSYEVHAEQRQESEKIQIETQILCSLLVASSETFLKLYPEKFYSISMCIRKVKEFCIN